MFKTPTETTALLDVATTKPSSSKGAEIAKSSSASSSDESDAGRSFEDRGCGTEDENVEEGLMFRREERCGVESKVQEEDATYYLWFSACAIGLNAMSLGYDVGCMNGALGLIKKQYALNTQQEEIIDGCLNIFAAFGALFAARIADGAVGRRGCLASSAGSYLAGCLLSMFANSWQLIAVGRCICGIAVGLSFSSGGLYLSEIAPAHLRGTITSFYEVGIDLGILLGSLVGYGTTVSHTNLMGSQWRFMVGFGAIMPVLVLVCVPFLPESPRWLLANGKSGQAKETLELLFGQRSAARSLVEYKRSHASMGHTMATWPDLFRELWTNVDGMRPTLLLVMALGVLQQATGSESILYYCNNFLKQAGMKSASSLSLGFIFVGLSKLLGNIPPTLFSDRWGRLPFYHTSSIGMTAILFALIIVCSEKTGHHGGHEVILMCLFLFFFSFGVGTLLWVVVPELLPFRWRARGLAAVVALNRLTSATVTLTALSIIQHVRVSGFFTIYFGFAIASLLVNFLALPETAGQSLEQLAKERGASEDKCGSGSGSE